MNLLADNILYIQAKDRLQLLRELVYIGVYFKCAFISGYGYCLAVFRPIMLIILKDNLVY